MRHCCCFHTIWALNMTYLFTLLPFDIMQSHLFADFYAKLHCGMCNVAWNIAFIRFAWGELHIWSLRACKFTVLMHGIFAHLEKLFIVVKWLQPFFYLLKNSTFMHNLFSYMNFSFSQINCGKNGIVCIAKNFNSEFNLSIIFERMLFKICCVRKRIKKVKW